ncbi:MAG: glycosyltransferase family 4 protein [Anaeromyxobacter sp.]|nr:glycosyltransferase family 4 protein [Anaeromyxobacter sp.]
MKILLINQFFHPDWAATARLATHLAEDLVADGHEVTVLAARGSYLGGGGRLPAEERHQGIRIVRVASTSFGKASLLARLADYGSYYLSGLARALLLPRFDVVVAMSTPPMVATQGALLRAVKGTRFVYWVQDVYPELAVEFGLMRGNSLATRAFEWLSRAVLHRADAVVVLGEAMKAVVTRKGVRASRVHVLPNWADRAEIQHASRVGSLFRQQHGLAGKRVVLYSGNMGRAHDMATLLGAAERLRAHEDVVFLFVGSGEKQAGVLAAARDLPSIRVLPYQPSDLLSETMAAGDLHVVTQDASTLGLVEPSKVYSAMAAGRPILFIGPGGGEVARTVEKEEIGVVVKNGDASGAAAAILQLLGDGERVGARARLAFEERYERRGRTVAFEALLGSIVATPAT